MKTKMAASVIPASPPGEIPLSVVITLQHSGTAQCTVQGSCEGHQHGLMTCQVDFRPRMCCQHTHLQCCSYGTASADSTPLSHGWNTSSMQAARSKLLMWGALFLDHVDLHHAPLVCVGLQVAVEHGVARPCTHFALSPGPEARQLS